MLRRLIEKLSNQYISFGNSIKDPIIPLHNDAYDWSEEKTYEFIFFNFLFITIAFTALDIL